MARDITRTIFHTLSSMGIPLTEGTLRSLETTYVRNAEDMVQRYHADALFNGLAFAREEEEKAVEIFNHAIEQEAKDFLEHPTMIPQIPDWSRVTAAFPGFLNELKEAVELDNR